MSGCQSKAHWQPLSRYSRPYSMGEDYDVIWDTPKRAPPKKHPTAPAKGRIYPRNRPLCSPLLKSCFCAQVHAVHLTRHKVRMSWKGNELPLDPFSSKTNLDRSKWPTRTFPETLQSSASSHSRHWREFGQKTSITMTPGPPTTS
jgi:hypothetical protein